MMSIPILCPGKKALCQGSVRQTSLWVANPEKRTLFPSPSIPLKIAEAVFENIFKSFP
jgi:hypothetical protein